jgi:hypothetical protein
MRTKSAENIWTLGLHSPLWHLKGFAKRQERAQFVVGRALWMRDALRLDSDLSR